MPHPSVPRRDGEGARKQDREHPSIASTRPGLGGSTHSYTSWRCTERRRAPNTCAWHHRGWLKHYRRRLKLTPRTPADTVEKTLQEHPRSYKASGATPATTRREEYPSKHQPLRVPNGYPRRGSGATVGDSHRGPLNNQGETHFLSQKTKHKRAHKL
jgi:hypothetical protein